MGGLFCNPAGHTTLAQERGKGEGGLMGCREEDRGGRGRTEAGYTTTFQPIPLLHPSVCELMVSSFFPTDDVGRSRLATSTLCAEVLGTSREGKEGRKQGEKEGGKRWEWEEVLELKEGCERRGKGRGGM